jgi:mono/diheme cytochrome c family protein
MKFFIAFIVLVFIFVSTLTMAAGPLRSKVGEEAFNKNCAVCHGKNGAGSVIGTGPPLVHKIYEPSHHGDASFYMAVARGVRAHHWSFGNMPPIKGVTKAEVGDIIKYIRALQREAGIN